MPGNTSNRGFASMDQKRQREIASQGGRAAHARGTAHEFTPEEAREAGRKGGEAVSRDRQHMAAIGREGGLARGKNAHGLRNANAQAPAVTPSTTANNAPTSTVDTTSVSSETQEPTRFAVRKDEGVRANEAMESNQISSDREPQSKAG